MKRTQSTENRLPDSREHGQISRRSFMQTMLMSGFGLSRLNGLGTVRSFSAQVSRPLSVAYQDWITPLHPGIFDVHAAFPDLLFLNEIPNFADAQNGSSPWDIYVGVTPFADIAALVESGVIEPWDDYIPAEIIEDIIPSIREEGSIDGKLYSWPFLVDVVVQSYNANVITRAGLADMPPTTWDEYLDNASAVVESGAAPIGCSFDPNGWRSLVAIAHTFSTDVYYTLEGDTTPLFDFTHPAAIQALEVMKQMLVHSTMPTANGSQYVSDEQVFESQAVGYYVTDHNAPLRFANLWDDPSALRLAAIPSGGTNSTVFWTTGACLFKNGQNKEIAAAYMQSLTYDERIWRDSIAGTETLHTGQLPPYQSLYAVWEENPPEWLLSNPWVELVREQIEVAKAIPNHTFGVRQFVIAKPHWENYLLGSESDPLVAMQAAKDAVVAAIQREG
ncbi:MAG: extracellular solute-binding protein [Burkholderiales bacterium]|nr:extracellular solute-binding protein [Anaerolineae bacterium]